MVKLISIGRNFTQCNEDADKTCFPGKLDQTLDLSYYPMLPQHNPSFLPSFLLPPSALCHRPCPWEAARSKGFNLFPQRKKKKKVKQRRLMEKNSPFIIVTVWPGAKPSPRLCSLVGGCSFDLSIAAVIREHIRSVPACPPLLPTLRPSEVHS